MMYEQWYDDVRALLDRAAQVGRRGDEATFNGRQRVDPHQFTSTLDAVPVHFFD